MFKQCNQRKQNKLQCLQEQNPINGDNKNMGQYDTYQKQAAEIFER